MKQEPGNASSQESPGFSRGEEVNLISTKQAADLTRRQPGAIKKLVRAGRFPKPVKDLGPGPGRGFRFDRAEVEAWAAENPRRRKPGDPVPSCGARGCDRKATARGLCLMHYKRERGGTSELESPGIVDVAADGRLICAECGRPYHSLASHVRLAHGTTADEYRAGHRIAPGTPLSSTAVRQAAAERARERVGTPEWERFIAARDPEKAWQARDAHTHRRARETTRRRRAQK